MRTGSDMVGHQESRAREKRISSFLSFSLSGDRHGTDSRRPTAQCIGHATAMPRPGVALTYEVSSDRSVQVAAALACVRDPTIAEDG